MGTHKNNFTLKLIKHMNFPLIIYDIEILHFGLSDETKYEENVRTNEETRKPFDCLCTVVIVELFMILMGVIKNDLKLENIFMRLIFKRIKR